MKNSIDAGANVPDPWGLAPRFRPFPMSRLCLVKQPTPLAQKFAAETLADSRARVGAANRH